MAKVVSLVDTLRWTDGDKTVEEDDAKGKDFDVPDDEAKRLEEGGSAAKASSDEAKAAKKQVANEPPASESEPPPQAVPDEAS